MTVPAQRRCPCEQQTGSALGSLLAAFVSLPALNTRFLSRPPAAPLAPRRPVPPRRPLIRNVSALHSSSPSSSTPSQVDPLTLSADGRPELSDQNTAGGSTRAAAATGEILRDIDILRVTDHWVAVSKPPGVLMHRTRMYRSARGERYLVECVRRELSQRLGRNLTVFPVHRLDRATSGVVLFGLDEARNAALLQEALQARGGETSAGVDNACKQYWALAFHASQMPEGGHWVNDHPLKDLPTASGQRKKNRVQRSALTHFRALASFPDPADVAVLQATLTTGRRHQIRRHLSYSHIPVVGDTSHGNSELNHAAAAAYNVPRLCLHARRLRFTDPFTKQRTYLQVPVPEDLRQVVRRLPGYAPDMDAALDLDDPADLDPAIFDGFVDTNDAFRIK